MPNAGFKPNKNGGPKAAKNPQLWLVLRKQWHCIDEDISPNASRRQAADQPALRQQEHQRNRDSREHSGGSEVPHR